jgi:hypothetical protein
MARPALLCLVLAAAAPAPPAAIIRYFISPMGQMFTSAGENPLDLWFRSADSNHDGAIDRMEMLADARRQFDGLDLDHNHLIEPDEVDRYEQQLAALMRGRSAARGGSRPLAGYGLLDNPEPVASADADMNRIITAQEFDAAAVRRFDLLDTDQDGRIVRAELPDPPGLGRKARRSTTPALDSGPTRSHDMQP